MTKRWDVFMEFTCVCQRRLQVPAELAGRRVRCPACRAIVWTPATEVPFAQPVDEVPLTPASTPLSRAASVIAVTGGAIFLAAAAFVGVHCPQALLPLGAFAVLAAVGISFAGRRPALDRRA
ncbi:MAG: hypothetical protein K8T20_16120 [Planctomycetes bacterium]|nr:hypothetical protein [Planctomycetota bacterium]